MTTKTVAIAAALTLAFSSYALAQSGNAGTGGREGGAGMSGNSTDTNGNMKSPTTSGSSTTNNRGGQTGTQGAGGTGSAVNGTPDRNDSTSRPGGTNPTAPR
jgi:hypothetical protein